MKRIIEIANHSYNDMMNSTRKEIANHVCFVQNKVTTKKDGSESYKTNILPLVEVNTNDSTAKVLRSVLTSLFAHYKVTENIQNDFRVVYDLTKEDGTFKRKEVVNVNSFLNTTTLYFVDKNGKFNVLLESEVTFNKTALKITKDMNILGATSNKERKNIIKTQSELILKQSTFVTSVNEVYNDLTSTTSTTSTTANNVNNNIAKVD